MHVEVYVMGFSSEVIARHAARQERRSRWITEPGLYAVTIVNWRYRPACRNRDVVFDLLDDQGRRQEVSFSLSMPQLYYRRLRQFIGAALGWDPDANQGPSFAVANAATFKKVVGKPVLILVERNERGLHTVTAWSPVRPAAN